MKRFIRLIIFLIILTIIKINFINAQEKEAVKKIETHSIREEKAYENILGKEELIATREDKQLEEELRKKFSLAGETDYRSSNYMNTSSISCKNPTSKINTLDCVVINIYSIIIENNLNFEFIPDIDSEDNWEPTKKETIEILKENSKIKYESYLLEGIEIRTNAQTHKRILYAYLTIKSSSFYKKSISIKLIILDNGLYEVVGGFSF